MFVPPAVKKINACPPNIQEKNVCPLGKNHSPPPALEIKWDVPNNMLYMYSTISMCGYLVIVG